jgi:hypothetical protein
VRLSALSVALDVPPPDGPKGPHGASRRCGTATACRVSWLPCCHCRRSSSATHRAAGGHRCGCLPCRLPWMSRHLTGRKGRTVRQGGAVPPRPAGFPGCLLPLPQILQRHTQGRRRPSAQLPALLVPLDVPPPDGPKGPQRSSRPSRSAPALPGVLVAPPIWSW